MPQSCLTPPNHVVIVLKENDDVYHLEGTRLTKLQLLCGLGRCGFDISFCLPILPRLKDGGEWRMFLTSKQIKTIKGASAPFSTGTGFGS